MKKGTSMELCGYKPWNPGVLLIVALLLCLSHCSRCSRSGRTANRLERHASHPGQASAREPAATLPPSPRPLSPLPDGECLTLPEGSSFADIAEKAGPAIFLVLTQDARGNTFKQGSGFFVAREGIGMSNHHVFDEGEKWTIQLADGSRYRVAEVLSSSIAFDFVVFRIAANESFPCLSLSEGAPRVGEDILVLGNPMGLEQTLTRGIISSLRRKVGEDDIIQIDAAISPGSSGSPVLNTRGEVIGIATMKIEGCENCNFAYNIHCVDREGVAGLQ